MSRLGKALGEAELPSSERARERTVSLATRKGVATPTPVRSRLFGESWTRYAVAATALAAVLVTPMGRDAISWAGDLVGIGDSPSVSERPDQVPPSAEQVVIGTGSAPDGASYEVVAYATESSTVGNGAPGEPCVFVDFTTRGRSGQGTCGELLGAGEVVGFNTANFPDGRTGPPENPYVDGFVGEDVARVSVRLVREGSVVQEEQPTLARLDGQLQERVGASRPVTAFVAFLPAEVTMEDIVNGGVDVEAVAYSQDGSVLARDTLSASLG